MGCGSSSPQQPAEDRGTELFVDETAGSAAAEPAPLTAAQKASLEANRKIADAAQISSGEVGLINARIRAKAAEPARDYTKTKKGVALDAGEAERVQAMMEVHQAAHQSAPASKRHAPPEEEPVVATPFKGDLNSLSVPASGVGFYLPDLYGSMRQGMRRVSMRIVGGNAKAPESSSGPSFELRDDPSVVPALNAAAKTSVPKGQAPAGAMAGDVGDGGAAPSPAAAAKPKVARTHVGERDAEAASRDRATLEAAERAARQQALGAQEQLEEEAGLLSKEAARVAVMAAAREQEVGKDAIQSEVGSPPPPSASALPSALPLSLLSQDSFIAAPCPLRGAYHATPTPTPKWIHPQGRSAWGARSESVPTGYPRLSTPHPLTTTTTTTTTPRVPLPVLRQLHGHAAKERRTREFSSADANGGRSSGGDPLPGEGGGLLGQVSHRITAGLSTLFTTSTGSALATLPEGTPAGDAAALMEALAAPAPRLPPAPGPASRARADEYDGAVKVVASTDTLQAGETLADRRRRKYAQQGQQSLHRGDGGGDDAALPAWFDATRAASVKARVREVPEMNVAHTVAKTRDLTKSV